MANYYETTRSNYFSVKDVDAFKKYISNFDDCEVIESKGRYGVICDNGIPSCIFNEDGDDIEVDFLIDISKHLTENSIAIFMGAGAENHRYVNGWTTAINHKGEIVNITLDDIYAQAAKRFGSDKEITQASY